ncbi:MAG: hypothetical protein JWO33_1000 [Caulobacteraceae bacterium]|nr:hypothetical protein [Caulobacteraceae bacterium]
MSRLAQAALAKAIAAREAAAEALDQLERRRADLAAELSAAQETVTAAGDGLADNPTADAVVQLDAAAVEAQRLAKMLDAIDTHALAGARERLEGAVQAEVEAERTVEYASVGARLAAFRQSFEERYPAILRELESLGSEASSLNDEVRRVNGALPSDAQPLSHAEAFRDRPARPEQVIARELVTRWVFGHSGQFVTEERVRDIVPRREHGGVLPSSAAHTRDAPKRVEHRRFWEETVHPAQRQMQGPRLSETSLPMLTIDLPADSIWCVKRLVPAVDGGEIQPEPEPRFFPARRRLGRP